VRKRGGKRRRSIGRMIRGEEGLGRLVLLDGMGVMVDSGGWGGMVGGYAWVEEEGGR